MMGIPPEIDEAAQLGASWWLVFTRFNLPLSRSALAAAFTSSSVWVLNELLFGITLSFSQEVRPVMAPLAGLQGSYGTAGRPSSSPWLLVSLPAVIIFLAFQRSSSPPANQHRTQNRQQHLPAHPRRARVAIYTKVHDRLLPPLTAADRPPAPVELRKP